MVNSRASCKVAGKVLCNESLDLDLGTLSCSLTRASASRRRSLETSPDEDTVDGTRRLQYSRTSKHHQAYKIAKRLEVGLTRMLGGNPSCSLKTLEPSQHNYSVTIAIGNNVGTLQIQQSLLKTRNRRTARSRLRRRAAATDAFLQFHPTPSDHADDDITTGSCRGESRGLISFRCLKLHL